MTDATKEKNGKPAESTQPSKPNETQPANKPAETTVTVEAKATATVQTPPAETASNGENKPAESNPVVESKPSETPTESAPKTEPAEAKFDATILDRIDYRWLAGLDKQATNETTPLVVGNRYGMGSTRQTSLVGTINGREIKAIENYKPNLSLGDAENPKVVEAYLVGETFTNGKGESQVVLASDPAGKYLNAAGQAKKALVEQIQKWYDDPQDSYSQDQNGSTIVRDMVRDGILARTLSLIVQSVFGTGRADTLRGIKFVKLLSESDETKQSLVWDIVKFAEFDGMSLANFDRARVYDGAKYRYASISDMCGISTKSESATKVQSKPVEANAADFAALLSTVPAVPKNGNGASQSKESKSNPAPTGNLLVSPTSQALEAAKKLPGITSTGETIVHAGESGAPALVKSESEKTENENSVTPVEAVKPTETTPADNKPIESSTPAKEDTPAEEKKTE